MAKITKARAAIFSGAELESYVVAGTPAAYEYGIDDNPTCVVCGSHLKYVFVTSLGIMGGDCAATITGDDSTRKQVASISKALRSQYRDALSLEIERCSYRPVEWNVRAEYRSDYDNGPATFSKFVACGSEKAIRFAVMAWADEHNVRVKEL